MKIKTEQYNNEEELYRARLSNRFLEAFQPEVFQQVGFPTRIYNDDEVYRFIDSMVLQEIMVI